MDLSSINLNPKKTKKKRQILFNNTSLNVLDSKKSGKSGKKPSKKSSRRKSAHSASRKKNRANTSEPVPTLDSVIDHFQKNPNDPQFFYFVSATDNEESDTTYNLDYVTNYIQLRTLGKTDKYYTISSSGVTLFTKNGVTFNKFEEWVHERQQWLVMQQKSNIQPNPNQQATHQQSSRKPTETELNRSTIVKKHPKAIITNPSLKMENLKNRFIVSLFFNKWRLSTKKRQYRKYSKIFSGSPIKKQANLSIQNRTVDFYRIPVFSEKGQPFKNCLQEIESLFVEEKSKYSLFSSPTQILDLVNPDDLKLKSKICNLNLDDLLVQLYNSAKNCRARLNLLVDSICKNQIRQAIEIYLDSINVIELKNRENSAKNLENQEGKRQSTSTQKSNRRSLPIYFESPPQNQSQRWFTVRRRPSTFESENLHLKCIILTRFLRLIDLKLSNLLRDIILTFIDSWTKLVLNQSFFNKSNIISFKSTVLFNKIIGAEDLTNNGTREFSVSSSNLEENIHLYPDILSVTKNLGSFWSRLSQQILLIKTVSSHWLFRPIFRFAYSVDVQTLRFQLSQKGSLTRKSNVLEMGFDFLVKEPIPEITKPLPHILIQPPGFLDYGFQSWKQILESKKINLFSISPEKALPWADSARMNFPGILDSYGHSRAMIFAHDPSISTFHQFLHTTLQNSYSVLTNSVKLLLTPIFNYCLFFQSVLNILAKNPDLLLDSQKSLSETEFQEFIQSFETLLKSFKSSAPQVPVPLLYNQHESHTSTNLEGVLVPQELEFTSSLVKNNSKHLENFLNGVMELLNEDSSHLESLQSSSRFAQLIGGLLDLYLRIQNPLSIVILHWKTRIFIGSQNLGSNNFPTLLLEQSVLPTKNDLLLWNINFSSIFSTFLCLGIQTLQKLHNLMNPLITAYHSFILDSFDQRFTWLSQPLSKSSDYIEMSNKISKITSEIESQWNKQVNSLKHIHSGISIEQQHLYAFLGIQLFCRFWFKSYVTETKISYFPSMKLSIPNLSTFSIQPLETARYKSILQQFTKLVDKVSESQIHLNTSENLFKLQNHLLDERKKLLIHMWKLVQQIDYTVHHEEQVQAFGPNCPTFFKENGMTENKCYDFLDVESNVDIIIPVLQDLTLETQKVFETLKKWDTSRYTSAEWFEKANESNKKSSSTLAETSLDESSNTSFSSESSDANDSDFHDPPPPTKLVPPPEVDPNSGLGILKEIEDPDTGQSLLVSSCQDIYTKYQIYLDLWTQFRDWKTTKKKWLATKIKDFDSQNVLNLLLSFRTNIKKLASKNSRVYIPTLKELLEPEAPDPINGPKPKPLQALHPTCTLYQDETNDMARYVEIVDNLKNPSMRVRHWQQILVILQAIKDAHSAEDSYVSIASDPSDIADSSGIKNTLARKNSFLQLDLETLIQDYLQHMTTDDRVKIQNICILGVSEEALAQKFRVDFFSAWNALRLSIEESKSGIPKIVQIDEFLVSFDDVMVTLSSIQSSRYVGPILDEVEKVESHLKRFNALLTSLTVMQTLLTNQNVVFREHDIRRQLPADAKTFLEVRGFWVDLLSQFAQTPQPAKLAEAIFGAKTNRQTDSSLKRGPLQPNLIKIVDGFNQKLEFVHKQIEQWLDVKRQVFSRFYYLNNEELVSILSQSKDPRAIQPHLGKCFEGLYRVIFAPIDEAQIELGNMVPDTIVGFSSVEGEQIKLAGTIRCRGPVEKWACTLAQKMRKIIRQLCKDAVIDYEQRPRVEWCTMHPGQLVLVCAAIHFCKDVETALSSPNPPEEIDKLFEKQQKKLSNLSQLVITNVTGLQRKVISALITLDVHHRDILEILQKAAADPDLILNKNSFSWGKQMRYYWTKDDNVMVQQVSSKFPYGWEYLGCSMRLVVTELTGRCYTTCLSAVAQRLGASPQGPAGTGKTETVKDLAKSLGIQCIVFNCNDTLDAATMGRFFSGLAQTGAWVCFDEFNRLRSDVLSVIATQLLTIRRAILARKDKFLFEGENISLSLDPIMAVFITMNPGYAGRAELPANLKAVFRPVAMMKADYNRIAEVMLFSQGFSHSTVLARKLHQLYQLSAQQLSPQKHYDFGMRAIKSLLVMAGSLLRASQGLPEDVVLIQAIKDSNIPKLVPQDISLFTGLISDLWPSVQLKTITNHRLKKMVETILLQDGYCVTEVALEKTLQFWDTLVVRHGAMILGCPGSGKTVILKALAKAVEKLYLEDKAKGPDYKSEHDYAPVVIHLLHPKTMPPTQLYGGYSSNDKWSDGVVARAIKAAVADSTNAYHWVVFDGPVDAVYIENMNTCLDDNKMLCLDSGERIKMTSRVRLIFEVTDLSEASPATISRCGMVYISETALELGQILHSFLLRKFGYNMNTKQLDAQYQPHKSQQIWEYRLQLSEVIVNFFQRNIPKILECSQAFHKTRTDLDFQNYNYGLNRFSTFLQIVDSLIDPQIKIDTAKLHAQKVSPLILTQENSTSSKDPHVLFLNNIEQCLSFASIWGFGSALVSLTERKAFSKFIKKILNIHIDDSTLAEKSATTSKSKNIPPSINLFEWCYVPSSASWVRWTEIEWVPKFNFVPSPNVGYNFVPTSDVVAICFIAEHIIRAGYSVCLTGDPSSGKTVISNQISNQLSDRFTSLESVLSSSTPPGDILDILELRLDRLKSTLYGFRENQKILFIADEVHRPLKEDYGSIGSLELLRQLNETQGFYDRDNCTWKSLLDLQLLIIRNNTLASGCNKKDMSTSRFLRHLAQFNVPNPIESESSLISLIQPQLYGWFGHLQFLSEEQIRTTGRTRFKVSKDQLKHLPHILCRGLLKIFETYVIYFPPKPETPHYRPTIRHLSRILSCLLFCDFSTVSNPAGILRAAFHETIRVFGDMLMTTPQLNKFNNLVEKVFSNLIIKNCKSQITSNKEPVYEASELDAVFESSDLVAPRSDLIPLIFGTFTQNQLGNYVEVNQKRIKIAQVFRDFSDSFSLESSGSSTQDSLVFFQDCCVHLTRILRFLSIPATNALLLGKAGTGKKSMTRFAAKILNLPILEIKVSRTYGLSAFEEDLRKVSMKCGIDDTPAVILLAANGLPKSFLESVNIMLSCAYCTYQSDEMETIVSSLRMEALAQSNSNKITSAAVFTFYLNRVKKNLHFILTMTPGIPYMELMRDYPAIQNISINIVSEWKTSALEEMSLTHIKDLVVQNKKMITDLPNSNSFKSKKSLYPNVEMLSSIVCDIHDNTIQTVKNRPGPIVSVTPYTFILFLSYINNFHKSIKEKLFEQRRRLDLGVSTLKKTNASVAIMRKDLQALQPVLAEKAVATSKILVQVEKDQVRAKEMREAINKEAQIIEAETKKTSLLQADAQKDLDAALPALEAAVSALNSLNKGDISEIKAFTNPPALVKTVMEAVCILMGAPPTWKSAKEILSNPSFIKLLISFDKDNIPQSKIDALGPYLEHPEFNPERISQVSKAATSLCMWVQAMDVYHRVILVVAPKRAILEEATKKLNGLQEQLAKKQADLADVEATVAELEKKLKASMDEKNELEAKTKLTSNRLETAGSLVLSLNDEAQRWGKQLAELQPSIYSILVQSIFSAAALAYLGPLNESERMLLLNNWHTIILKDLYSNHPKFDPLSTLTNNAQVRSWQAEGLPLDNNSALSAALLFEGLSSRWPLFIDPQDQARNWLLQHDQDNGLIITSVVEKYFNSILKKAIQQGTPVLVENIDPGVIEANFQFFEPILSKSIKNLGGRKVITIGDDVLDYHDDFRLYLTTTISGPNYSATVFGLVQLIDFAVTPTGLENQLLSDIIRNKRPSLEEKSSNLATSIAADQTTLNQLESKILNLLTSSTGNILDDTNLVNTLKITKKTSTEIAGRMEQAISTNAEINSAREVFRDSAKHCVALFQVVSSLENHSFIYTYSLQAFKSVINKVLLVPDDPNQDIQNQLFTLNKRLTLAIYTSFSRSLFNEDKLSFSKSLSLILKFNIGQIPADQLSILFYGLTPSQVFSSNHTAQLNKFIDKLSTFASDYSHPHNVSTLGRNHSVSTAMLEKMLSIDQLADNHSTISTKLLQDCLLLSYTFPDIFSGLTKSFIQYWDKWMDWFNCSNPLSTPMPDSWSESLNDMNKLVLLRVLSPDRFYVAAQEYVNNNLGEEFLMTPPLNLQNALDDVSNTLPIFFMLKPGIDPTSDVYDLLEYFKTSDPDPKVIQERKDMQFYPISLGQGVLPGALSRLHKSLKNGDWVMLANLHLVPDFLTDISSEISSIILSSIRKIQINPNFRLFLTAEKSPTLFPSILRSSLILSMEAPKGVRNSLTQAFQLFDAQHWNLVPDNPILSLTPLAKYCWPRLLYVISLANAIINGRLKYGPLGMNIQSYGFSLPDLQAAIFSLRDCIHRASSLYFDKYQKNNDSINVESEQISAFTSVEQQQSLLDNFQSIIPWDELVYMASEICFGGRITDDWDRRLVKTLITLFYNPSILNPKWSHYNKQIYYPIDPESIFIENSEFENLREEYLNLVSTVPKQDDPSIFGLDPNVEISLLFQQSNELSKALGSIFKSLISLPTFSASMIPILQLISSRPEQVADPQKPTQAKKGTHELKFNNEIKNLAKSVDSACNSSSETSSQSKDSCGDSSEIDSSIDVSESSESQESEQQSITQKSLLIVNDLLAILPKNLVRTNRNETNPHPINDIFLDHEIEIYNTLLTMIKNSLVQIKKILLGNAVSSPEFEEILHSLQVGQVPEYWTQFCYETPKIILDTFMPDLIKRIATLDTWIKQGPPVCHWLSGYFDPRGFLKFVLQNHARNHKIPLDDLELSFHVVVPGYLEESNVSHLVSTTSLSSFSTASLADAMVQEEKDRLIPKDQPKDGVFIQGVYIDAARWNDETQTLDVQQPGVLFEKLPVIHVLPKVIQRKFRVQTVESDDSDDDEDQKSKIPKKRSLESGRKMYSAPLYKTPSRAGLISTTGLSTNFICTMDLPISEDTDPKDWIIRSTAVVCILENDLD